MAKLKSVFSPLVWCLLLWLHCPPSVSQKNSIFPTLKSLWTVTAGATSARPPKTAQQKMVS